jgi:hypothetical protein
MFFERSNKFTGVSNRDIHRKCGYPAVSFPHFVDKCVFMMILSKDKLEIEVC